MMKIVKLKTLTRENRRGEGSCLPDVPCQLGAIDGICERIDSPCTGPGVADGDCYQYGDQPCAGAIGADMCNQLTGRDMDACVVFFGVDKEAKIRPHQQ